MGSEKARIIADKKRVKEIYGNRCAGFDQCQNKEKPHIHHIVFKAEERNGSKTHAEIENKANYIPLCWECEKRVHELTSGEGLQKSSLCFKI